MGVVLDAGSYRDPAGRVFLSDGRVFRTIEPCGAPAYEFVRDKGILSRLALDGRVVKTTEVAKAEWPLLPGNPAYVVEHTKIPFISYPYEWGFAALKAAALHHLQLQLDLFDEGVVLSDATAYNVQFVGPRPVFIDVLSFRPYRQGEYWLGHRQFCEQFLNPLLLRALLDVPHNAWYRGRLEGIPTAELARLIPWRKRFSWNVYSQVILQAGLERRVLNAPDAMMKAAGKQSQLSPAAYRGMLLQLRNWVKSLTPRGAGKTVWGDYAQDNSYASAEAQAKRALIRDFAERTRPGMLVDMGCNSGDFSVAALEGGAQSVLGFDFDQQAVDRAFHRAQSGNLAFLPLWLDSSNPSPDQGWRQAERQGFAARTKVDALIALAFEHHMVIGKNISMDQLLDWLVAIAPVGLIEFVPKNDPMVQRMLSLRDDIFADYDEDNFQHLLSQRATIVNKTQTSASGRVIFEYARP